MLPDLCYQGPEHPWLADWQLVIGHLNESPDKSMVREVPVDEKWYQQTMHFVQDAQRIRIYGADFTVRKQAGEALSKAYAEVEKRIVERTADAKVKAYLAILESNLNEIVSPLVRNLGSKFLRLSHTASLK